MVEIEVAVNATKKKITYGLKGRENSQRQQKIEMVNDVTVTYVL